MRYMVAKVRKDEEITFGMFGGSTEALKFEKDIFYTTIEDAEEAIRGKYQADMDKQADETWNSASDAKQTEWAEKLKDANAVLHSDRYIIIPVASVIEINGVPKHLRKED